MAQAIKKKRLKPGSKGRKSDRAKHSKEDEYYRGIIREQEKTIRSLERRIKDLNKLEHFKHRDKEPLVKVKDKVLITCPHCNEGKLEPIFVVGRSFFQCDNCSFRTKAIKT